MEQEIHGTAAASQLTATGSHTSALRCNGQTAKRVIDAREQVVAPGFIDMLGHSENSILRAPQRGFQDHSGYHE